MSPREAPARAQRAGLDAVAQHVDARDALAVERALTPLGRADLTVGESCPSRIETCSAPQRI